MTAQNPQDEGLRKVLEVLLEAQIKYASSMRRYFGIESIIFLAKEKGEFTGQFGRDEVISSLERASQLQYLEKSATYVRVGCKVGMVDTYRIDDDKINLVRKLLGKK